MTNRALPHSIASPQISVVMPVYNGEPYLAEAVESVLNQSFTDFEFIIINDASSDQTAKILADYSRQDQRIKLFTNQFRLGIIQNLNKGLSLAQGEYIARQDADDISLPQRFEKQVQRLKEHPETVLVSCNLEIIDFEGKHLYELRRSCHPGLVAWYLLFQNRLAGHSQVMFRKAVALKLDGYSEAKLHIEDYDLWSRLANIGSIDILPEILLKYRSHENSISSTNSSKQVDSSLVQSKLNIEHLLHTNIDTEVVRALKAFWALPDQNIHFPALMQMTPGMLQKSLRQIYLAFLNKSELMWEKKWMAKQLACLISQQFFRWSDLLGWRRNFYSKLSCLFYALMWDSSTFVRFIFSTESSL